MNFNTYIFLTAIALLGLFSCEVELDIAPITKKASINFYSNEQELENAINGVYAQLQNRGLYGLDLIGVGEISAEDSFEEIAANDDGRFGQLDDFSTNASNDLVGDIWRESYKGIQRANTVLNRIDGVEYKATSIKTNRIGEITFIRALLYFNLVRLYGDVPLVTKETESPFDFFDQGRTSSAKVYTQIKIDLTDAIKKLPAKKESGKPAKGAAQALLGDVLLTQGDFDGALTNFKAVVGSDTYKLTKTTAEIFGQVNEGNSEILFEVQFASGFNVDGKLEGSRVASQFRPSGTTSSAKGHNLPTQAFIDLYETTDTRLSDYVGVDPEKNPFYYSTKHEVSSTGANDGGSDYIIIRYTDVILKYAESLNEKGQTPEAIVQLNRVRTRAGLADTDATDKMGVRSAIRQERRFELIGEGQRWFDLKRYGTAVTVMNAFFTKTGSKVSIDEDKLILPIPQSQVDADPTILQNKGY